MATVKTMKAFRELRRQVAALDHSKDLHYAAGRWMDTGGYQNGYSFEIVVYFQNTWQASLIYGSGGYAPERRNVLARVAL